MSRSNNPGVSLSNSMMSFSSNANGTGGDAGYGMNAVQSKVFKLIKSSESRVGMHRDHIQEQFPKHQQKEVK